MLDGVAAYQVEGGQGPAVHTMAPGDFAGAAVGILMSHYKVKDKTILRTTALAM